MTEQERNAVERMVDLMNSSKLFRSAAKGWKIRVYVRILDKVVRAPLNTFAAQSDDWAFIEIDEGRASTSTRSRLQDDLRNRVEFEVEAGVLEALANGESTVGRELLRDRLVAGGVLAHWTGTLIHLAQAGDEPARFLPSGRTKGFMSAGEIP
jgi:hypothetical protein